MPLQAYASSQSTDWAIQPSACPLPALLLLCSAYRSEEIRKSILELVSPCADRLRAGCETA
jgi:hypothetical protein